MAGRPRLSEAERLHKQNMYFHVNQLEKMRLYALKHNLSVPEVCRLAVDNFFNGKKTNR